MEIAKENLISFTELVNPEYNAAWFHEEIADRLQGALRDLEKGISRRIIIEMPPRHGKTELATINFPAWILGHHPDWPIITASYSSELAVKFGFKTRDIMLNPVYGEIFKTKIRDDSKAKGNWITPEGGGYLSAGVGGSITGSGFRVGIIDDPFKNREQAESSVYRDSIWDWFTSTFMTRQDGVSLIIVINTRWHLDDLVARIENRESEARKLNKPYYDKWEYITYKAIAEEKDEHRDIGDPLWPERFTLSMLLEAKERSFYDFAALYQQTPIPAGHQEFKKEWIKVATPEMLRGKTLTYYTTIDPAIGEGQESDNSGVLTVGKERSGPNWYRIEETAGHLNPLQLIDAIFYHQKKYRSSVWLETIAYQKSLMYFIEEEKRKREQYFIMNELKNNRTQAKTARIRGLVPLYASGVIYHGEADQEYEKELLEFPYGKHDDRLDCMASMLEAMLPTQYEESGPIRSSVVTNQSLDPYYTE